MTAMNTDLTRHFELQWKCRQSGEWGTCTDHVGTPEFYHHYNAADALALFEEHGDVLISIEDGFLCSANIYPQLRKKHKQVQTFKKLIPVASGTLQEFLNA